MKASLIDGPFRKADYRIFPTLVQVHNIDCDTKVINAFLDDCDEIPKLYEFWKSNQVQLDKLKNDDEEQYEKIKSSFTDKKIKLQGKA